jgi:ATP-grasp domain, R2K clade family 3
MMLGLFCSDPRDRRRPDGQYAVEAAAAGRLGIPWAAVDHDAVERGDVDRALRHVPDQPHPVTGLYRGWMMTVEQYEGFYHALAGRGIQLVNDPAAYRHCHHLPESYPVIAGHTPRTVWLPGRGDFDLDAVMDLLRSFGDAPVVVKDYVKSQKHAWAEACFIPSAADRDAVGRVVRRFVDLQGAGLVGGLVFREFVEFEPVGRHPRSGMPLTLEYRLFLLDGGPILVAPYWEGIAYEGEGPPIEEFISLAGKVRSRFFTVDVAKKRDGDWLVVELGDGQVAGLPDDADVEAFYRVLSERLATGASAGE